MGAMQLGFFIVDTQELLPFAISRTVTTKAEDVLGLELYVDPVTGKKGYRWHQQHITHPKPEKVFILLF